MVKRGERGARREKEASGGKGGHRVKVSNLLRRKWFSGDVVVVKGKGA